MASWHGTLPTSVLLLIDGIWTYMTPQLMSPRPWGPHGFCADRVFLTFPLEVWVKPVEGPRVRWFFQFSPPLPVSALSNFPISSSYFGLDLYLPCSTKEKYNRKQPDVWGNLVGWRRNIEVRRTTQTETLREIKEKDNISYKKLQEQFHMFVKSRTKKHGMRKLQPENKN